VGCKPGAAPPGVGGGRASAHGCLSLVLWYARGASAGIGSICSASVAERGPSVDILKLMNLAPQACSMYVLQVYRVSSNVTRALRHTSTAS